MPREEFDFQIEEEALNLKFATRYFQETNQLLIKCIELIERILSKSKLSKADIQTLESTTPFMPLCYFSVLFQRLSKTYYMQEAEIALCLLEGTFSEAWSRAIIFYGNEDVEKWKEKHRYYNTEFIRRGFESECLIEFMSYLYSSFEMLNLCFQIARGEIKQIPFMFEDDFGLHTIKTPRYDLEKVEKQVIDEPDLRKKQLIFQNEIFRMKIYLNEYPERQVFESEEEYVRRMTGVREFIGKCEMHLESINEIIEGKKTCDNKIQSPPVIDSKFIKGNMIHAASKRKTDIIKILSAMYDARMFADADGKPLTNKQKMMEAFGEFLGDDFSTYSASLSQAKTRDEKTFMKPFAEIEKAAERYLYEE